MDFKFSILIVTYNRLELLKESFSCALQQLYSPNHIIIVNNGSTEETFDFLKKYENNKKIIICNIEKNVGATNGFCKGIEKFLELNDDWLLIIDDDAMLSNNYLFEISKYISKNKGILAYSGTVKTDNQIIQDHRRRMVKKNNQGEIPVPISEYDQNCFVYDISSFCGLIVNKKVIKEVGLPNKNFYIQYDDSDYSLRISKHTSILNVNSAILNHKTILMPTQNKHYEKWNWKMYYGNRNKIYSCTRNGYLQIGLNYALRITLGSIKDCFNPNIKISIKKYNLKLIINACKDGILGNLGRNKEY